jgi:beta-glucosidase
MSFSRLKIVIAIQFLFPLLAAAQFPVDFKWCSATAAHQVEGNNIYSDWWLFESIPGHIKNNERSGIAANQWTLIDSDIQKMKSIGLNSYRFSVEWAKIQPTPDHWDTEALLHYQKQVQSLKRAGIEPIVTLHHFTLPLWVAKNGGWASVSTIQHFVKFSQKVFETLGADVNYWVTFNEPTVLVTAAYLDGVFPPSLKGSHDLALTALKNILTAHAEVVSSLRAKDSLKKSKFGFAHHLRVFDPANKLNPLDHLIAFYLDQIWNWAFTEALVTGHFSLRIPFQAAMDVDIPKLAGSQDFFGLNYYSRDLVQFTFAPPHFERIPNESATKSDLGWEIYPRGLGLLIEKIHSKYPQLPILITENGIADSKDQWRGQFIKDHLVELENEISKGIKIIGYCHWSLLDNFEWAEGFSPRFGLYEVNYSNQERKLRNSSLVLSEIITSNTTRHSKKRSLGKPPTGP